MAKSLADFAEDGDVEEFEDLLVRGLEIPKEVWEKYKKATRPQDPDFDEIAKLCGCPEWDYPGQVLRDIRALVKERDEALDDLAICHDARAGTQSALLEMARHAEAMARGIERSMRAMQFATMTAGEHDEVSALANYRAVHPKEPKLRRMNQ